MNLSLKIITFVVNLEEFLDKTGGNVIMEVVKSNNFDQLDAGPFVLTIGTFDGIHLGHKKIIQKAIKISKYLEVKNGVFSFSPHPLKIINPDRVPLVISSYQQKLKLLEKLNVDHYFDQLFNRDFAHINFHDFVRDVLVDHFKVKHIVVGKDFRFGYKNMGNVRYLNELGEKYNFKVSSLKPVTLDGKKISSTIIRRLIKNGDIEKVIEYLGRYYQLEGNVIYGHGRGKKIGFPTANIELATNYVLPPNGVYAVYAYYQGNKYKAIANFGFKPTFSDKDYSIEIHFLNLEKNLYGEKIYIDLVDFIRDEITFTSTKDLKKQIDKDILYTRKILC